MHELEKVTKAQIQKIHILLNNIGQMDWKADYVSAVTDGRATSSKELTFYEADYLIKRLAEQDPKEMQLQAIFKLSYKAGMSMGSTPADRKMNVAKINAFLRERGTVKKDLYSMTVPELIQVHRQFEGIVNSNRRTRDNKEAKAKTAELLQELNLTVL